MEAVAATAAPTKARDPRALAGDLEAFNSLYRPHLEAVYDFAVRIVGERDLATDMVRQTFRLAWRSFPEQGNDVAGRLFTTARVCTLDALRYRRDRNGKEREALHFTRIDGHRVPDPAVFDQSLAELVWDAACALPREAYSLLALHVRHDLSPDAIGLDRATAARLARTREFFDKDVTIRLLATRARHTCGELDILVARDDEHELAQHIRRCKRCRETASRFVSPAAVLGSLATIAPSRSLARELFNRPRRRGVFGIL